jgi:hypothetical protein
MYIEEEFTVGVDIKASCHDYLNDIGKLEKGTEGTMSRTSTVLGDA